MSRVRRALLVLSIAAAGATPAVLAQTPAQLESLPQTPAQVGERYGIDADFHAGGGMPCEITPDEYPVHARALTLLNTLRRYERSCGFDFRKALEARGAIESPAGHFDDTIALVSVGSRRALERCTRRSQQHEFRGKLFQGAFLLPGVERCDADQHAGVVAEAEKSFRSVGRLLVPVPEPAPASVSGLSGASPSAGFQQHCSRWNPRDGIAERLGRLAAKGSVCAADRDPAIGARLDLRYSALLQGACGADWKGPGPGWTDAERGAARHDMKRRLERIRWEIETCLKEDARRAYRASRDAFLAGLSPTCELSCAERDLRNDLAADKRFFP